MKLFNALNPLNSNRGYWVQSQVIGNITVMDYSMISAIVALVLIFAITKNYLTTKKMNKALKVANLHTIAHNEYLEETLAALQESSEEKSRVLQIIAHDLRSPMAAIVGLAGLMLDENQLSDEDREIVLLIHTSGQDSLKFINEILDRESAIGEVKKENVELYKLLSYCVSQLQYKAKEKHQQIILTGTPINTDLNREKIWRVLTNLITNAIKFSPMRSKISVELRTLSDKVAISVKDNGIGIPEELKDKIFSTHVQKKRVGTAGEKSFGLGLAVAKQNVELHGGSLTFTSDVGKGSTFLIELPLAV